MDAAKKRSRSTGVGSIFFSASTCISAASSRGCSIWLAASHTNVRTTRCVGGVPKSLNLSFTSLLLSNHANTCARPFVTARLYWTSVTDVEDDDTASGGSTGAPVFDLPSVSVHSVNGRWTPRTMLHSTSKEANDDEVLSTAWSSVLQTSDKLASASSSCACAVNMLSRDRNSHWSRPVPAAAPEVAPAPAPAPAPALALAAGAVLLPL